MNEQLQQALTEILTKTVDGIDSGVEFMHAELPDVIEQLLMWYAVKGVICFLFGLLLILAWVATFNYILKRRPQDGGENFLWERWSHKDENELKIEAQLFIVISGILAAIFSMVYIPEIMTTIKIWIAPKIWIIEYTARLVK